MALNVSLPLIFVRLLVIGTRCRISVGPQLARVSDFIWRVGLLVSLLVSCSAEGDPFRLIKLVP